MKHKTRIFMKCLKQIQELITLRNINEAKTCKAHIPLTSKVWHSKSLPLDFTLQPLILGDVLNSSISDKTITCHHLRRTYTNLKHYLLQFSISKLKILGFSRKT